MARVGVLDLDMLAADMAKMLDRYSYEIDASADDIRPHLDAFIASVQATIDARPEDEPGEDAATWTPSEQAGPAGRRERLFPSPKLGRVRVFPIYVFPDTSTTDPDRCEIWITDYDKQGLTWAAKQAEAVAAENGGRVGSLLRKEQCRWHPPAGTPKDARP